MGSWMGGFWPVAAERRLPLFPLAEDAAEFLSESPTESSAEVLAEAPNEGSSKALSGTPAEFLGLIA